MRIKEKKYKDGWKRLSILRMGSGNPNWRGDTNNVRTGRTRAYRWFKSQRPCEECGDKESERHHVDGNPLNNVTENIKWLCRRHHMKADGRTKRLLRAAHESHKLNGRWSIKHTKCVRCGTTEVRHHRKGLCRACDSARRYKRYVKNGWEWGKAIPCA